MTIRIHKPITLTFGDITKNHFIEYHSHMLLILIDNASVKIIE
jgi:hypothetical protein